MAPPRAPSPARACTRGCVHGRRVAPRRRPDSLSVPHGATVGGGLFSLPLWPAKTDGEAYTDVVDGSLGAIFSVVMKHQEHQYGDSILDVVGIDLSLNSLTGGIPDEITSLKRLLSLNLSWNQLSGEIVEKIGAMNSLESLDLSQNKFSGEIPPSLADLTYLSYLDLSYNNLTGRIPQGSQLDTLYAENPHIYDGNNGLYGPPLQRNCFG